MDTEDASLRSSSSPRPRRRTAGLFPCLLLAAGFGFPALATDGTPDGGSFGFGGPVCGSGGGASALFLEPPPEGFSLCLDLPAAGTPERAGVSWDLPLEPPVRPPSARGEPLRGVRNASSSFGKKFLRGTLIITGTEIASGVVLALLPKENTKWDADALSRAGSNFARAWTELPTWDGDNNFHNWIGHPYAGAFYYNMIRSQGGTVLQSFGFAAFQTVMWEYVLESWAEQPSIQDLVTTSIMGAALGELFHRWSVAILRKGHLNFGQKALVFFLNPSYVINNGYRPPG